MQGGDLGHAVNGIGGQGNRSIAQQQQSGGMRTQNAQMQIRVHDKICPVVPLKDMTHFAGAGKCLTQGLQALQIANLIHCMGGNSELILRHGKQDD